MDILQPVQCCTLGGKQKLLVALGAAEIVGGSEHHNGGEKFENGVWTEIERVGLYIGFKNYFICLISNDPELRLDQIRALYLIIETAISE